MKAHKRLAFAMTIILGLTPAISNAQGRGPVPISEAEPGLLAQANVAPAMARLTAFGEFPGAQLVAAGISRQGNRIVYSFDLKFTGRDGNERVQVDALTGQVCRVEYTVSRDPEHYLVPVAPSELLALVKTSFATAREVANTSVEHAHVRGCKLRVESARTVYVFDLEVGDEHAVQQALIDARTGAVLSPR